MPQAIRILKFEAKTCPVCQKLNKRGVLDHVKAEFPTVDVVTLCVTDENGMAPDGTSYAEAYSISDVLQVDALPCLVFVNSEGIELGRHDGAPGVTELRKLIDAALAEADALESQKRLNARLVTFALLPKVTA